MISDLFSWIFIKPIKIVNSKQLRKSSNCGMVVCIHDNLTIIHIYCDNMTIIHYKSDQIVTFDASLTTRQLLTVEIHIQVILLVYTFIFLQIFYISEVVIAVHETNIHMIYS